MKKLITTLIVYLLVATALTGFKLEPVAAYAGTAVSTLMEKVRNKEVADHKLVDAEPPCQVIAEARRYLHDSESSVRMEAVALVAQIAQHTSNRLARKQAADSLFEIAATHGDSGLAGYAIDNLLMLPEVTFTPDMQQTIYLYLMSREKAKQSRPGTIRLAGVAGVRAAAGRLREFAARGDRNAVAALARMGDEASIQAAIAHVRSATSTTDRVSALQDLAFIRQPRTVEALVGYLFSEEWLTTNFPPKKYAQRAVGLLAEIIEDFPVETGPGSYQDVAVAREWMTKQGSTANLKIKR